MKLRLTTRLALTVAVAIVPFAVIVALYQVRIQADAFEEQTARLVRERMESQERAVCEARPDLWPMIAAPPPRVNGPRPDRPFGPRPGKSGHRFERRMRRIEREMARRAPELAQYAYGPDFISDNVAAPDFPHQLADALRAGDEHASIEADEAGMRLVATRMPWVDGPCAIVMVRRPAVAAKVVFRRALLPALLLSLLAVIIAVLAGGPIVRRIRRLTMAVRSSAAHDDGGLDVGGHDEIAELARAFETRRERIREHVAAIEARDETLRSYVANTTHDVMLPLTVIQGHLAALERDLEAGNAADPARVGQALEECHYLGSLVHNLTVAAKLEGGAATEERHPVDLNQLVERVVGRNAPYARQRDVSLAHAVPEAPCWVTGDVTLIEQAVGNVVHNAIRYNGRDGHVAIVLEVAADEFSLRVIDDGPGLPDAELARITERGFRGDRARSRHPTGSGLGLAICKDVCLRHGFELCFERPAEGGLEVRIEGAIGQGP